MTTLTPDQQKVLEWLVKLKQENKIEENFRVYWRGSDNAAIDGEIEAIPELVQGALDAICLENLIICNPVYRDERKVIRSSWTPPLIEPREVFRKCTFTGKAFQLVENNFQIPNSNIRLDQKYAIVIDQAELRKLIKSKYDRNDFEIFCSDLDFDLEDLRPSGLENMILNFIEKMRMNGRLLELIVHLFKDKNIDHRIAKTIVLEL